MKILCDICNQDLSGKDVEYHYSRNHEGMNPPYDVILASLRESNELISQIRKTRLSELVNS